MVGYGDHSDTRKHGPHQSLGGNHRDLTEDFRKINGELMAGDLILSCGKRFSFQKLQRIEKYLSQFKVSMSDQVKNKHLTF